MFLLKKHLRIEIHHCLPVIDRKQSFQAMQTFHRPPTIAGAESSFSFEYTVSVYLGAKTYLGAVVQWLLVLVHLDLKHISS